MRITCDDESRSLRPPSCCSVDVMNGAFGEDRYGFSSTERTPKSAPSRPSASALARVSSIAVTFADGLPRSSKSFPVATLTPSTATSRASNGGSVAVPMSMSQ